MTQRHVTIIGGGVAGLAAALELAAFGIQVDVIEKTGFLGGHAIRLTCKATDACVRCGACMAEEKLRQAVSHPGIALWTNSHVENIHIENGFTYHRRQQPIWIDPGKCTGCGDCFDGCPQGAIVKGTSASHKPFFSLDHAKCTALNGGSCDICLRSCPHQAIQSGGKASLQTHRADAILMATGFSPYNPQEKPYGYGRFPNVVTNLELEAMMRREGKATMPSNGAPAERIAFIQCVGSRDQKLNHLWCSKVCCGSALRMAGLIKFRQPQTDITCFYIDIQTFGRDFASFYSKIANGIRMVRAIPGDIFEQPDHRLKLIFADPGLHTSREEIFDQVVLSIGLCPNHDMDDWGGHLPLTHNEDGFLSFPDPAGTAAGKGFFVAGTAAGPMSIPEAVASAGSAAKSILNYLEM